MKRRKKNRNVETFDVYPHLPQYQYNTGMPSAKRGGDFFTYDDYLTSTVLAQTGIETDEYTTQSPTNKIKGNELKDGYADYGVPEWMQSSPLAAAFGMVSNTGKFINNLDDNFKNINPATGKRYSKLDFAKTTLTNTTDENAVIDGAALANAFDWKGDIKKGKNNAENLLMTQKEAQAGYYNQLSDYHSNTFVNDDGSSIASKQSMDREGNIMFADITEDNPAFNPMLPEGPDNLKTITRAHNETDLTSFDKAQENLKDYGVNRIQTKGDGTVTEFSRYGPENKNEIYDPLKPYNDQVIIGKDNIQENLNLMYGGSTDLKRFTDDKTQEMFQRGGNYVDQPVDNECTCPPGYERSGETYLTSGPNCADGSDDNMNAPSVAACGNRISNDEAGPVNDEAGPVEVESPNAEMFKNEQEEFGYLPWEDGYTEANDANNYEGGININEVVEEPATITQTPTGGADSDVDNIIANSTTPLENTTPNNDPVIDVDYGNPLNRVKAATRTGAVGVANNLFQDGSNLITQIGDGIDVFAKDAEQSRNDIINSQKADEAMEVNPTIESSRGAKGDFDVNTGDYRVMSLGYGDGPRGQIAQMGQEMGAPSPDYSYLQQFLNSTVVGYEPEMLMMQAKDGSEVIDADMDLIKQLMAAGADFEMI